MRALMGLVVGMGILIIAGVAVVAVTILHRMGAAGPRPLANSVLQAPAGSHITGVGDYGGKLAIILQGGGPDRVVLIDPATGKTAGSVTLGR